MNTLKQAYISQAANLNMGDFTKIKTGKNRAKLVTEIANGYCLATDNGDEQKRSQYISALMLLFYGEISKMVEKCKFVSGYEFEDYAYVLYNCIEAACQYRAWQKGKFNAEQCIRQSIASRGAAAILYKSNLDKEKANVNAGSLDSPADSSDDSDVTFGDTVFSEEDQHNFNGELVARNLVQTYINNKKIVESIILDSIAFGDSSIKTTKIVSKIIDKNGKKHSIVKFKDSFLAYRLVKLLSTLPDNYAKYFSSTYNISSLDLEAAIERIRNSNNQKLYKMVEVCLAGCKSQFQNCDYYN